MTYPRIYTQPAMIKAKQHFDIIVKNILTPKCKELGRALSMQEVNHAIAAYAANSDLSDFELNNIQDVKWDMMIDSKSTPQHSSW